MSFYECYLFGSAGEIGFCEQIEGTSEASAIELCRRILATRPSYAAFELWQFRRKICGEARRLPIPLFVVPRVADPRSRLRAP
jgi:hypothetical protein